MGACLCGCARVPLGFRLELQLGVNDPRLSPAGGVVAPTEGPTSVGTPTGTPEESRRRAEGILRAIAKAPPPGASQWTRK